MTAPTYRRVGHDGGAATILPCADPGRLGGGLHRLQLPETYHSNRPNDLQISRAVCDFHARTWCELWTAYQQTKEG
ncbi:MAG: hypothetical protein AB7U73_01100 [Pirellulales bacterium]